VSDNFYYADGDRQGRRGGPSGDNEIFQALTCIACLQVHVVSNR
jgi:hypothetical protein